MIRLISGVFRTRAAGGRGARQLDPDHARKGWWTILRLYSPLEPFFTKQWRPSEVELVQ